MKQVFATNTGWRFVNGSMVRRMPNLGTRVTEGECPRALYVEVMAWVAEHRDELMEEWTKWHP